MACGGGVVVVVVLAPWILDPNPHPIRRKTFASYIEKMRYLHGKVLRSSQTKDACSLLKFH